MKKFIFSLIQFLVFLGVTYVFIIIIWGESFQSHSLKKNLNYKIGASGHMYSRMKEVKTTKNVDILFLGSSLSYRGFDPRIFKAYGLKTFNLGSSAQTPLQTRVLLKRYLNILNPKLIIYEVFPGPFTSDGVESSLDIIANDGIDFELCRTALSQKHIKVFNTLIYGIYRDCFNRNAGYVEDIKKDVDSYVSGGYVETSLRYFKKKNYGKDKYGLNKKQLAIFKDIIRSFNERKIPYVLVQAPITRSRYNSYINNNEYNEIMKKQGIYYNFNEIIELDDTFHFYDSHHLNQQGVELFNKKLINLLLDSKILSVNIL